MCIMNRVRGYLSIMTLFNEVIVIIYFLYKDILPICLIKV